jgi:tRNA (guanine-N7-)-methyltransferase
MRVVISQSAEFSASDGSPRFAGRPVTRFERKGVDAGRVIHDVSAVRRAP